MALLIKLSEKRPIYYLHPSFGYYFELFYPVPHGLAYEMKRYSTNYISPPPLTEAEIAGNETFWKSNEQAVNELAAFHRRAVAQQSCWFPQNVPQKASHSLRAEPHCNHTRQLLFRGAEFLGRAVSKRRQIEGSGAQL